MCRSKEQGGQRCSAHAKAGLLKARERFLTQRSAGGVDAETVDRFLEGIADYVSSDRADVTVLDRSPLPDDPRLAEFEALLTLVGKNRRSMHSADYRVWRAKQTLGNEDRVGAAQRERDRLAQSVVGQLGTLPLREITAIMGYPDEQLPRLAEALTDKITGETLYAEPATDDQPPTKEELYNSFPARLMRRYLLRPSAPPIPDDLAGPKKNLTAEQVDAVWRKAWAEYSGDEEKVRATFEETLTRSSNALRKQLDAAAAISGNTGGKALIRMRRILMNYYALPEDQRPHPPSDWVKGVRFRESSATKMPDDLGTLWAVYRLQADPSVLPDDPDMIFASVDLETAGPDGPDGFKPSKGDIIEVAVVRYNQAGERVGQFTSLARPSEAAWESYQTGAVDIHGIESADVADAPEWSEVAKGTAAALDGAVLLAHNTPFEQAWLSHHVPGHPRWEKAVDTLRIARQHMGSLPQRTLSKVCEAVGVDYTDGHRAKHDAVAAGEAFFRMRDRMRQEFRDRYGHLQ